MRHLRTASGCKSETKKDSSTKKKFGGLAFLLNGNMSIGVHSDELIVRLPPDQMKGALSEKGARPFEVGGRQMKGWLLVGGEGIDKPAGLKKWIDRGVTYAASLPGK